MVESPSLLSPAAKFAAKFADEQAVLERLLAEAALPESLRAAASLRAADLVRRIRAGASPSLMENFLAEYGLSTREGVALMCLAEAMLRVPDAETIDALIEDKIAPSDWSLHLGSAASPLVNASTWALMLTGRVLDDDQPGLVGLLRGAVKRLGEPVIRLAVGRAMKEMGRQFVLGETIGKAMSRAKEREAQGFTYSYDMLGEAALTSADAARYARSYEQAIAALAGACVKGSVEANPGISVKLSALHPRYEAAQEARVMAELVPRARRLALQARAANMGFNIDAEEQDRLILSLKVIEAILEDPAFAGWDGFGVVVQAYGKRAGLVLDRLNALAARLDRRIMVRLVKGAYWDSEMKRAQVEGLPDFTLFTSKTATDVSYLTLAKKLFGYADRIYPQFATHNAQTAAAVLELAEGRPFEFQRLHGMGERLHDILLKETGGRCRIYAPVGAHRDLLAYLVRRLLENGANSSFVHQIVDEGVAPETIAADPVAALAEARAPANLKRPEALFGAGRRNARGFDLTDAETLARIDSARAVEIPEAGPILAVEAAPAGEGHPLLNPATGEPVALVREAGEAEAQAALGAARPWAASVAERAAVLRRAADLYEADFGPFFAVLAREAGKTLPDCLGELREAVDFLRYYAAEAENLPPDAEPLGVFAAISPWNFPLAIFTGQIAAALATGNGVLAKPAEQTPLVAAMAVRLLHEAGVPPSALQLLPGPGETVGAALTSDPRISGVVFTGSTETARRIRRSMAEGLSPSAPLIAETGGLNAMIVDSTALPEQAARDVVASAFRSAGQRCSALRCLYLQEEIAPHMIEMIRGVMDEQNLGDPWRLSTDIGPAIDVEARDSIEAYLEAAEAQGRLIHRLTKPAEGCFVSPAMIRVAGIEELEREVFGPVLHVATWKAGDLEKIAAAINARGYGLTFGLHTRIDSRVQEMADRIQAGNLYVNRNQIGAVVGSQPFGGEGLSGTGPKAGGPLYLARFLKPAPGPAGEPWTREADLLTLRRRLAETGADLPKIETRAMPGPTGETNRLTLFARAPVLCLGPGEAALQAQIQAVRALGGLAVGAEGNLAPEALAGLAGFGGVLWWGAEAEARRYAQALAARPGPILPLIGGRPDLAHVAHERHLCVDVTAAGGDAALLAGGVGS
ncbi:bifunctional proline dehydrogenase/L-glutamate gamma-semialdehyde dehydrogenase PutA [Neomegalonema sp.]|uniref:bifunctional proline dehydrogenase/L-glutamate gamma-semialdehyde dehydrogenase PutA n=1 Tax=Neomegalonema sp. TaxID=2039713 RepID=UPI0026259125|nr:bifunctional proline dehydrogenase/L-glutamate gamma-semialdehyde dehydrogenase PutA [Neomegalonema sp.]MDD2867417.1 bifunctional proline dehydrogenase/L-glutamate gamma-semialdehyde dehydrogenase PutA [Neomegalonema sp.]